jgi:predicted PhzF superfamily epimerase YddE/YHI9
VIRQEVIKRTQERVVLNLQVRQVPVTFASADDGSELLWMNTKVPEFGRTHPAEPFAELLGLSADEIDPRVPNEEVSLGVPFTIIPLKRSPLFGTPNSAGSATRGSVTGNSPTACA